MLTNISENIEHCSIPINQSTPLGYGNVDTKDKQTQEYSLFFKDSDYINNTGNSELNRYEIDESTDIYLLEDNEIENLFLSPETQLNIEETKIVNSVKAYKCTIKNISIHFSNADLKVLTAPEDRAASGIEDSDTEIYYQVINEPSKLWIYYFDFNKDPGKANLRIRPLATLVSSVWSGIKRQSI